MNKPIENHMVLPYADDDSIPEPQERDEPTDAERAENIRKRSPAEKLNDELREITNCVDRAFRLLREMAE